MVLYGSTVPVWQSDFLTLWLTNKKGPVPSTGCKTDSNKHMKTHLCVFQRTMHRGISLQQRSHTEHAFCMWRERWAKKWFPSLLSCISDPPPKFHWPNLLVLSGGPPPPLSPSEGGRGGSTSAPPLLSSPWGLLLPLIRLAGRGSSTGSRQGEASSQQGVVDGSVSAPPPLLRPPPASSISGPRSISSSVGAR